MTIRKTPTILVVEDDAENRAAMVKVLEGAEYKVVLTDNGQQAIDILNEEDIDILVTDLRLPVMDGVELLKRIRSREEFAKTPIFVFTNVYLSDLAKEANKAGATSMFDKSIAVLCGVYSTPQAVLLDTNHKLYYRGNYNKSRYCTDKNSDYARMAIDSLLHHHEPVNNEYALKAYGCQLPGCTKN